MNLYIMNGLSGITGIVEVFESMIWNMQFYSVNDFQVILPLTSDAAALLQPGILLVREPDVGSGEYHNVMRIENRTISFNPDKGWLLTISGGGLKKIVGQRVIWEQINFVEENVETAIRQVITDNIISPDDTDRTISNFVLDTAVGFTDTFDAQLFGEKISEWIESTCQIYGYGWDVYIKNGKYVFTLIKPTDRSYDQISVDPVVFSPTYDNLASATYEYQGADYHNVGLVGGEGDGSDQIVTYVGSGSGLDRYETYIDGNEVSSNGEIISMETYLSMLQTFGREQLADGSLYQKFSGEIILDNEMFVYGEDYFLGDVVQVDIGYAAAALRIVEMIYSEDSNGSSLIPTFGDQEV